MTASRRLTAAGLDENGFILSASGRLIRAAQGRSVDFDLGRPAIISPEFLYHGTVSQALNAIIDAPNSDIFDVLAYVRFTLAHLARAERADAARSSGLGGYELEMRQVLKYVLQAYEVHGVEELSLRKIRDFLRIRYGGTNDAKAVLGSVSEIRKAFIDIQGHLFR